MGTETVVRTRSIGFNAETIAIAGGALATVVPGSAVGTFWKTAMFNAINVKQNDFARVSFLKCQCIISITYKFIIRPLPR